MNRIITAVTTLVILSSAAAQAIDLTPDQLEQVKLKSGKWMEEHQKATALAKQSQWAAAESIYKQIITERQALGLDLLTEYDRLGALYMSWGKPQAAEKTFQEMITAREKLNGPDDPQVIYPLKQYADFLAKAGRQAEAKALLARAASIQKEADTMPTFPKITTPVGSASRIAEGEKMRTIGEKLMISDLQPKAAAYFNRAIQLNANDAMALCGRGEAESSLDQNSKAAADFDRAIKLKPSYAKAYVDRAYLREGLNQYRLAIADFDKAIALNPKDTSSMGGRAKLLDEMGKHHEAVDSYTKLIATDPTLYWPYVQRAVAYTALGLYKPAIADYTTLVARAPEDCEYREFRADVYLKAGDPHKALEDYDKIIQLSPKYSIAYHKRAKAYEKLDGKKSPRVMADYAMAKKLGYY